MKFLKETIETTKFLQEQEHVIDFTVVGSAIYHEDPKDLDFPVLVREGSFFGGAHPGDGGARWAFGTDWSLCGGEYDDQEEGTWGAIRKDNINLIVTVDPEWYARAKLANEVCVALKLQDKGDRIVVYRVIRDGYSAEAANARRDGSR